jgi:CDP-4-dehydro-6-deoxyglucose reductase
VGVTRGALQKRIISGELATFEGMVAPEDLVRVYPQTPLEGPGGLERYTEIKDQAFSRRVRERIMPDAETLLARVTDLSHQLLEARARLNHYDELLQHLDARLAQSPTPAATELHAWLRQELARNVAPADDSHALVVRDTLLRLMVAQVRLLPDGREFFVEGKDTVLEAALRAGLSMAYGCSDGSCGLCKARVVSGEVRRSRASSYPLSADEQQQGYTLLCAHAATTDLVIEVPPPGGPHSIPAQQLTAQVKDIDYPAPDMAVLRLRTPPSQRLRFLSGQHVLLGVDGVHGDFPVASCPCDERHLQFHVRRNPADAVARHVFGALRAGDAVTVAGPHGDFVLREESAHSLIFIALDDGFASIKSLIEHAMALDVAETLHLYWVVSGPRGHYLDNLCRAWADALDNFFYTPVTVAAGAPLIPPVADLARDHPLLAGLDVFVAGPPAAVAETADLLRRRGLADAHLFVDSVGKDA